MEIRKETRNYQIGQISKLTQRQIADLTCAEQQRDWYRQAAASGRDAPATLEQRMKEEMDSLTAQIALLTQAVAALTAAIQENTETMGGEEEEVAQTGGLLGTPNDDEPEAPHL